jgi:hypothetical protein
MWQKSSIIANFISSTPQDLSNIQDDPKLENLGLDPPPRYQDAGGSSQQTLFFLHASLMKVHSSCHIYFRVFKMVIDNFQTTLNLH